MILSTVKLLDQTWTFSIQVVAQLSAMNNKLNTLTQVVDEDELLSHWTIVDDDQFFIQTVLLVEKRIGLVEEQVRLLSRK